MTISAWGSAIALLYLGWCLSLKSLCPVAYTSSLTERINTHRKIKSILEIKEEENNYLDLESGLFNLCTKDECQLLQIFFLLFHCNKNETRKKTQQQLMLVL